MSNIMRDFVILYLATSWHHFCLVLVSEEDAAESKKGLSPLHFVGYNFGVGKVCCLSPLGTSDTQGGRGSVVELPCRFSKCLLDGTIF